MPHLLRRFIRIGGKRVGLALPALGDRRRDRRAGHRSQLFWVDKPADVQCGGSEERIRVQLLDRGRILRRRLDVTGNRDDRRALLPRVQQAVEQVHHSRPRGTAHRYRLPGQGRLRHRGERVRTSRNVVFPA
jgi:hypothetical protein